MRHCQPLLPVAVAVSVSSESRATEVVNDVMVDVSSPAVTQR